MPSREPYSPNEVAKIIAAADTIGRGAYERLRARAMVLLLRYTALYYYAWLRHVSTASGLPLIE